ncbi:aspartate/glutamate racemase family protein [Niallia taxi]|uniref:aspartate/glutamate racemase family protein n=1 Tax=Niallia TaxID=2837506 RepID=UPI0039824916
MNKYKVGLIHATLNSVNPILEAFAKNFPDIETINFMDEGLLRALDKEGEITAALVERFASLLERAVDTEVDGILLSCSAYSPTITEMRKRFPQLPIENVDDAMIEQAVKLGSKIGVVATVATAGPTTEKAVKDKADILGKEVEVLVEVNTEAFAALNNKEFELHDSLIASSVEKLLNNQVDLIILAQLSMARAKTALKHVAIPILTSPEISSNKIVSEIEAFYR